MSSEHGSLRFESASKTSRMSVAGITVSPKCIDGLRRFFACTIPCSRFLQVDEAAALITWLCTEDCCFSTGAVFDLSGGRATY